MCGSGADGDPGTRRGAKLFWGIAATGIALVAIGVSYGLIALAGSARNECAPENQSAGSSVDKNRPRLAAAEARKALILMIERDHKGDSLLQGALPYLRTKGTKQVEDGVVEIGAWTCYLKERRFVGEYISPGQKIFARFTGEFVPAKPGDWRAIIVEQTRND